MCIWTQTTKNPWHKDVIQLCLIYIYIYIYIYGLSLNGWHALFCITNNRHDVTITTHSIKRHFLIWMTTVRTTDETLMFLCSNFKILLYLCLLVNETKNPQHLDCGISIFSTHGDYKNPLHLDVVDRYLRRMGDKTIPDEAPPSLESFYPPWVAGIDLP